MSPFSVILIQPERPANVGSAARALKNFGFDDLRLVGTRAALPGGDGHSEARALAWNAGDVLDRAREFETLPDACADLRLVAATSERAPEGGEVISPRELAQEIARLPLGVPAGCVFGPEDHGLTNEQLDSCRLRVRIPTRGDQPSMNLAQAVMVIAYEVAVASDAALVPQEAQDDDALPALESDLERLFTSFRALALEAGYLNPQAPEHVLGEIRRLLSRARPTQREVTLLLALVGQLAWAQKNLPRASP